MTEEEKIEFKKYLNEIIDEKYQEKINEVKTSRDFTSAIVVAVCGEENNRRIRTFEERDMFREQVLDRLFIRFKELIKDHYIGRITSDWNKEQLYNLMLCYKANCVPTLTGLESYIHKSYQDDSSGYGRNAFD